MAGGAALDAPQRIHSQSTGTLSLFLAEHGRSVPCTFTGHARGNSAFRPPIMVFFRGDSTAAPISIAAIDIRAPASTCCSLQVCPRASASGIHQPIPTIPPSFPLAINTTRRPLNNTDHQLRLLWLNRVTRSLFRFADIVERGHARREVANVSGTLDPPDSSIICRIGVTKRRGATGGRRGTREGGSQQRTCVGAIGFTAFSSNAQPWTVYGTRHF